MSTRLARSLGIACCGTMPHVDDLEAAASEYRDAEEALSRTRAKLVDAIIAAARSGTRQAEIVRVTGFTREHVRQICRQAGIGPKR
jgi:hypothetical protein